MKIIVCGAGAVGYHTVEILSKQGGHRISVIDTSREKLSMLEEVADILAVNGSSTLRSNLLEAGVADCDLLVAATDQDEINLLTAGVAKKLGVKKVIARVHNKEYIDDFYSETYSVDRFICPELLTAITVANVLENPAAAAIEKFAGDRIELRRFEVGKSSSAIGKKLANLDIPSGVRVVLLDRKGEFIIPDGETIVQCEDLVTLIGDAEKFLKVKKLFIKEEEDRQISILGGSIVSEFLLSELRKRNFSIKLFEPDIERAKKIADRYPYITVLNSDPTDPGEQENEKMEQCFAFIAASNSGEHNIMSALQAKRSGSKKTVSIIFNATYLNLIGDLGIDYPFSPRTVAANEILKLTNSSAVKRIASLARDTAILYEVKVSDSSPNLKTPLKNVKLPKKTFFAAVNRNNEINVPGAEDWLEGGDTVVIIGPPKSEKFLRKMFL